LAEVYIVDGETIESALRRFKRKVLQEDIIKETKRHSFYLKPGEKKRIKSALARKRNRNETKPTYAPRRSKPTRRSVRRTTSRPHSSIPSA